LLFLYTVASITKLKRMYMSSRFSNLLVYNYSQWGRLRWEKLGTLEHIWQYYTSDWTFFSFSSLLFNCKFKCRSFTLLSRDNSNQTHLAQGPLVPLPTHWLLLVVRNHQVFPFPYVSTGFKCIWKEEDTLSASASYQTHHGCL
jgi:hypothetical protein